MPYNKTRDYYRKFIKELLPYDKPFLVTGTYQSPYRPEDAYFCCFTSIFPYACHASSKLLCNHIHVEREDCEEAFGRFDMGYVGKRFVLCVRPYLYDDERGGLRLSKELSAYIHPVFPVDWVKTATEVYEKIPLGKVLDFRYLPSKWDYLANIDSYENVCLKTPRLPTFSHINRSAENKQQEWYQKNIGTFTVAQAVKEVQRVRNLTTYRAGKAILRAHDYGFEDCKTAGFYRWLIQLFQKHSFSISAAQQVLAATKLDANGFQKKLGKPLEACLTESAS